jgi:hypothetical protein
MLQDLAESSFIFSWAWFCVLLSRLKGENYDYTCSHYKQVNVSRQHNLFVRQWFKLNMLCVLLYCLKLNIETAWNSVSLRVCSVLRLMDHLARAVRLCVGGSLCPVPHPPYHPITSFILSWRQWKSSDTQKTRGSSCFVCSLHYNVMKICVVSIET